MVFSFNEIKFNLFWFRGRMKIMEKTEYNLHEKNVPRNVMVEGEGNMVFIENTMDKIKYLDILKNNMGPK